MDKSANYDPESHQAEMGTPRTGKRGRPPAEIISSLIDEGSRSHHKLKCDHCNRVFPREKSLSAHRRTHTGEKPYVCSFPNPKCNKSFAQSGQLKTHERLHTNEKCFKCPVEGCNTRYRHSNRKCPKHGHLGLKLIRSPDPDFPQNVLTVCLPEVREWLLAFLAKQERRHTPKRPAASQTSRRAPDDCLVSGAEGDGSGRLIAEHPSASRSLHYGVNHAPSAATDRTNAAKHDHAAEEEDWNTSASQSRSFGGLSLSIDGNGVSHFTSNVSSHMSCSIESSAEFTSPKNYVLKHNNSNNVSTPQRNDSLSLLNDDTAVSTPVRNSFLSTPKDSSHYATPNNKIYLSSSVESSYYSTPGGESTYGTPLGSSYPSTPSNSDYFSTPVAKGLNFPCLGSDLTSTPLASELFTPHRSVPSYHPLSEADHGLSCKSVTPPNKRAKSRRGLGPLMEATTDHNVKQEPAEASAHDYRMENSMSQQSQSLMSSSPSKRAKSRRGLGPLMEATTNNNIKQEPAVVPSIEARLESAMPLSSPSISSSICDENAYLQNENAPPRPSLPTVSPNNPAMGFRNTHRLQLPPKKMDAYRCLDMEGIQPLNIDESFTSDRYRSSLYSNNTKRVNVTDNHPTPSFTKHRFPAKVAMEMTAELCGSYSRQTEQEGCSPLTKYHESDAYSSSAQHQSKLRATLMGDSRFSPFSHSPKSSHTTGNYLVTREGSFKHCYQDVPVLDAFTLETKEQDCALGAVKQSLDCKNCPENNGNIYANGKSVSVRVNSNLSVSNSQSKKVSFAVSVYPLGAHDCPDVNDSYLATDSFTDEEEDLPSSADHSSASSLASMHENIYPDGSIHNRSPEANSPLNLSQSSLTSDTTLEFENSQDFDCPTIGDSSLYAKDRIETFPELNLNVMAPLMPSEGTGPSEPSPVTISCTPTKRPSPSFRNFSPRKVVPKKRWMSRIRSQVSAGDTSSPDVPSVEQLQPRATVLSYASQHPNVGRCQVLGGSGVQQLQEPLSLFVQHMDSDSQPLNLSIR